MLFKYKATSPEGEVKLGTIDAASIEIAISALQTRNLIIISLVPLKEKGLGINLPFGNSVKTKEIVLLSRQLATLFESKVPILSSFKLLANECENSVLRRVLLEMTNDLQGGSSLSQSMARHTQVFSAFFVNMVRAGEESGKLEEVFSFMAAYLERSYDMISKAKQALIYPAFVVAAFIGVIALMLTTVVPKLGDMIKESTQEPPLYTKVVLGASDFLVGYGVLILVFLAVLVFFLWRYSRTPAGKIAVSRAQLKIPVVGDFYKKFYLSRIADNLQTLITGGVSMVRSLEISADVVGNQIYKSILLDTLESVKSGSSLSESLSRYAEVPGLVSQMIKIGEESGRLDFILKTLAGYYSREVDAALATLINMIEPVLMLFLGGGVGLLMASILIPIYNIAQSI